MCKVLTDFGFDFIGSAHLGRCVLRRLRRLSLLDRCGDGADRLDYDADHDVQQGNGGKEDKDQKVYPCVVIDLHDRPCDGGRPRLKGHDLEQGKHGAANVPEQLGERISIHGTAENTKDIEDDKEQEQCPRHTGDRLEHGRYEDLQLGELRECLEQSEDTEGSDDRYTGGDEDDGAEDDDEVENIPAL